MNILYTNFHPHYGGGHDTYIKNLTKASKANVYVACPRSSNLYVCLKQADKAFYPNLKKLYSIEFYSKLKDIKRICQSVFAIKKIIESHQIDIVHTNGSADNRLLLYVKYFSKRPFKVVFTKHNSYPVKHILSRWRLIHFNDAIIFVSQSIYQSLGFSTQSKKISVIRNGIDIKKYINLSKSKVASLFTLVSNSGTAEHKGWHYLLHAIKLLPLEQQKKCKVILVGNKPSENDISKLVKSLPSCFIEWTGFTKTPENYLIQADVGFVLSDGCDTISFACREMMACGLPVIVSDFGGLTENIEAGIDGWVVPVGDIRALNQLLKNILVMSSQQLQAMSSHARQKAMNEFALNDMLEQTMNVYHKICNKHGTVNKVN